MHCGNEMSCVLQTSLPLNTPNLKIQVYLMVETVYGSGTYVIVTSQTSDVDANGRAKFFWHKVLHDLFEGKYDLPVVNSNTAFQLQHNVKRYYLFAVELSGSPQATTHLLNTGSLASLRFAVNGGLPKHRFRHMPFFGGSGWNLTGIPGGLGKAFLDWRGSVVRTRLTQDQWLYFIWQDVGSWGQIQMDLRVKFYRSDGLSQTINVLTTAVQYKFECWGYPAGFAQLGLSAYETSTAKITKYEVWLEETVLGTRYVQTEKKMFVVDRNYYELVVEAHYLNTYGVVCQLTLRGESTVSFNISNVESAAYWDNTYDVDRGESIATDVMVASGGYVASGSVSGQEAKMILELAASRKCLMHDGHQKYLPYRVLTNKFEFRRTQNVLDYSLEFVLDYENELPDLFL